ncbi:hypothetical protein Salat_2517200 [Sesamum alatum]|uniref:Uncharacterized protein n=1 Tax=Sesamum alatum TaxID=300844 RepID=A0AAE1XRZ5_9LAMI|nr:hypothetical protein Salat_2517200 [Sesamum alatum]
MRSREVLKTAEERAAEETSTRQLLAAYKSKIGLKIDPKQKFEGGIDSNETADQPAAEEADVGTTIVRLDSNFAEVYDFATRVIDHGDHTSMEALKLFKEKWEARLNARTEMVVADR